MKLLYCPSCGDIFNLAKQVKTCSCGKVKGYYTDNLNAIYTGGIPIGFTNNSFSQAVLNQPINGWGYNFIAFVIPQQCGTFKKDLT
jgi:hypothetical protein